MNATTNPMMRMHPRSLLPPLLASFLAAAAVAAPADEAQTSQLARTIERNPNSLLIGR